MTAQKKLLIQPDKFTTALTEWLSGDVTGHLGAYMYTDDVDDHRWKDGHSADTYYLGRDDKATFDIAIKDLNILVENLFDLGPGGEASVRAKSLPIAQAVMAAHYLPVDLSPTLARAAAQLAVDELNIETTPVIADFFEGLPIVKSQSLVALMGGTLGNIETYTNAGPLLARIAQIFSNYRRATTLGSFFLVSFDANKNAEEIIACYTNKELNNLVSSCVNRAIDISDFDYDVVWTPENYQLATGLRSKRDQMVYFDGGEFAVEQDEFLPVLNSYRFPAPFIIEAAEKSGWAHWKTWSATGRVHYLLFMAK